MTEIIAHNGSWLTQVVAEDRDRIFARKVKGESVSLDSWQEVTNEWKEQWEAEHPQPDNEIS